MSRGERLAAASAPVDRAGTCLRAPLFACTWLESAIARDHSIRSHNPSDTSHGFVRIDTLQPSTMDADHFETAERVPPFS